MSLDSGLAEHHLSGEVEKVLFESEDSSYSVIRVRDAQGILHCLVGAIAGAYPGQSISAEGRWELHKEHGRQLRVTSYSFTLPSTKEGIVRYLSSGIIKGVGEKYARSIVDTFGLETIHVLDHASVRLKEVPGLGRKRIEQIRKSWRTNSEQRNIRIYMQGIGISPAYFQRIYKLYGDNAVTVLQENPYRLASEVKGIGFLMADKIASQLGIQKNDPKRLVAGVVYALSQIRLAGHICMPEEQFLPYVAELLNVPEPDAQKALATAVETQAAASSVSRSGTVMIYEPGLLRCEIELPKLLASIGLQRPLSGNQLLRIPPAENSKFSEEQLLAVERVGKHALTIITGGPGVGKTTVVSEIVRRSGLAKIKTVLAAPTGRAAKRMSETSGIAAYTIHRLLKWDPVESKFFHCRANPLPYRLYIIDETSMLDLTLAVALFRAIPPGATVVMVGDPDQLPSVGPGNILNDMIESRCFPVTRLTRIFRQGSGSGIIQAAHEVNTGHVPKPEQYSNQQLTDFYWIERDAAEDVPALIEKLIAERIPARFHLDPLNDIQLLVPMNRGNLGTQAMNEILQNRLNPNAKESFKHGDRQFRSGDKVMQISNNYEKNVFNGDMGFITQIDRDASNFVVKYDHQNILYSFDDADQIVLAYAITVHKSQGSEFKAVVMPLFSQHYMMLQRNLLYTGMTRARLLMILIASEKAVGMAVRNAIREPRFSLFLERLKETFQQWRTSYATRQE